MAVVELLMGIAGLWLAWSALALLALAGVYVAERVKPRSDHAPGITGVVPAVVLPREAPEPALKLEAA